MIRLVMEILIVAAIVVVVVVVVAAVVAVGEGTLQISSYKYGHTASVCHYRFDQGYQPNPSLTLHDP